jgi:hypothetical protein
VGHIRVDCLFDRLSLGSDITATDGFESIVDLSGRDDGVREITQDRILL